MLEDHFLLPNTVRRREKKTNEEEISILRPSLSAPNPTPIAVCSSRMKTDGNASKKRVKSEAVCINDVLPLHLLAEVLIRVGSIELFRCKSVCKLWFSCIEHDPDFIGRCILLRSKEPPPSSENELDDEWIHVKWSLYETVMVTPAWYCLRASQLSLDFLPVYDVWDLSGRTLIPRIIGYSNGLLLCSYSGLAVDRYCICNPVTKQWLDLPSLPPCSRNSEVEVGFISDPFYHIHDNHSISVNHQFCVKVVRMDFSDCNGDENDDGMIGVEMFSSDSGCWTTFRVQLPYPVTYLSLLDIGPMVPCDGRLYCLVDDGTDLLVYDTNKNVFLTDCDLPSGAEDYTFRGLSLCGNSICLAQTFCEKLEVYTLTGCQWVLVHKVDDILRDMRFILRPVKERLAMDLPVHYTVSSFTIDPRNLMVGYMSLSDMLLECNFDCRTVTPVIEAAPPYLLPISLPIWPTPLPLLPNA